MAKQEVGCGKPTGGPVGQKPKAKAVMQTEQKEESVSQVLVGKKAPDFAAPAFHKGKFTQVKLSDYLGKWVVLCFYPGDFTFV